jgi:alpha-beta hydrolase superfamily lysophospholipase
MRATIVLVHGAFAESSSWDQVIDRLLDAGHPVIAIIPAASRPHGCPRPPSPTTLDKRQQA